MQIELIVYGSPAPQGSKKFVGKDPKTGRGLMVEMSTKVRPWRMDVKDAAQAFIRAHPELPMLDCALSVSMVFTLLKPTSAPKTRRSWPMRKPDVSKLARSTEDALSDAGLWADDARVVGYTKLFKVFPGEDPDALDRPGARIRITVLGEQSLRVADVQPSLIAEDPPPPPELPPRTLADEAAEEVDRVFG